MNPRTEALAEAMVAVPGSTDPFHSNPAGLAQRADTWVTYGIRGDEPGLSSPGRFQMWEAGLSSNWGTFSAGYHRFDRDYLWYESMTPVSQHIADFTAGAAWGYRVSSRFHVGAALKTVRQARSSTGPILGDAGVLVNIHQGGRYRDYENRITLGLCVQNLGATNRWAGLPSFARLGLSLQLTRAAADSESHAPLRFLAAAELMSTVNRQYNNASYAAVGVEFTIREMLSLRLGLGAPSQAAGGGTTFRFGGGLRVPLPILQRDGGTPLCLRVDYAAIPVSRTVVATSPVFGATFVDAASGSGIIDLFTIGLDYEGGILPR